MQPITGMMKVCISRLCLVFLKGKKILRLCKVPDTPWESVYVIELAEQGQEEQFKMLRNWRSTRHEYIPDETYYVLGGGRT